MTLIQVADRRITRGGKFDSNRRKVFEIPYLKASVGYFGLAQPTSREYFSSWLPNVIRHGHDIKTVKEFSEYLTDQLNKNVTKSLLETNPSGFHLCGLAEDGIPVKKNRDTSLLIADFVLTLALKSKNSII